jgi:hypothetical protein
VAMWVPISVGTSGLMESDAAFVIDGLEDWVV